MRFLSVLIFIVNLFLFLPFFFCLFHPFHFSQTHIFHSCIPLILLVFFFLPSSTYTFCILYSWTLSFFLSLSLSGCHHTSLASLYLSSPLHSVLLPLSIVILLCGLSLSLNCRCRWAMYRCWVWLWKAISEQRFPGPPPLFLLLHHLLLLPPSPPHPVSREAGPWSSCPLTWRAAAARPQRSSSRPSRHPPRRRRRRVCVCVCVCVCLLRLYKWCLKVGQQVEKRESR